MLPTPMTDIHSATQIAIPTSSHNQSATQKETSSSQLVHETVQVTHAQSSKGQGSKGNILLKTFRPSTEQQHYDMIQRL